MLVRRLVTIAGLTYVMTGVALAQTSASRPDHGGPASVAAGHDERSVPVEVRHTEVIRTGVQATLVNTTRHVMAMYEVAVQRADGTGISMTSASGLQWQPGAEIVVLLPGSPMPDDAQVVVRAAIGADGQEYGDPALLRRHRDRVGAHRSAHGAIVAVLDEAGVPATEQALQELIDRLALTMARAPVHAANETGLSAFVAPLVTLKRLQGRDVAGTERLATELRGLRDRLAQQAAAAR